MEFDLTTFVGIAAATTFLVGLIKSLAKKFKVEAIKGKEAILALLLPLALTVAGKISGAFVDISWVEALIYALGMGISSQIIHDKISNPALKKLLDFAMDFMKKKLPDDVPLESPAGRKKSGGKAAAKLDKDNRPIK